jgi:hypothetical protein
VTLQSSEVYGQGVAQVGRTVDKAVADTVALISKTDELNANMGPVHELAAQMCVFASAPLPLLRHLA